MTKFILHGGRTGEEDANAEAFFGLMAEYVPEGGTWLACYFANIAERETVKFALDGGRMMRLGKGRFKVAMAVAEDFCEQLKTADVVYFAGGSTKGLMNQIRIWPELKAWLLGVKVVAGSSAGMNMLGREYISKDNSRGQGLGLVPFNLVVHHKAPEYGAAHAELLPAPMLALHEGQFCVVEV